MVEPETSHSPGEVRAPGRRRAFWIVVGAVVVLLAGALLLERHWLAALLARAPERPRDTLIGVVDVFSCCILTWKAFTTMLPTFLLGGAIAVFAPTSLILRYLGARSNQPRAYLTAALGGPLLSLCSCNIVPLFASIYRRGAGIGPAFTFLFAGPAINILAVIFTFQVIGFKIGLWRAILVPVIAILIGLTMSLIYRREQQAALANAAASVVAGPAHLAPRLWVLFGLLAASVLCGAWEMPWEVRLPAMGALALVLLVVALKWFDAEERRQWLGETWTLVKLVVPVLLPAVLVIGLIATYIDLKLVYHLVGAPPPGSGFWGTLRPILLADVFGEVMYFPVLTEVAFTKAFLKLGMTVGPALALLLSGPGTSLPGAIIVARAVGWRKAVVFELLCIAFVALAALLFTSEIGEYICSCMMGG